MTPSTRNYKTFKVKNLVKRSISGIIYIVIVAASILFGQISFSLFMLFLSLLGLWEYANLRPNTFTSTSDKISLLINGLLLASVLLLIEFGVLENKHLIFIIIIVLFIIIKELILSPNKALKKIAESIFGLIYVSIPFMLMVGFHQTQSTRFPELLIGFFIILWFNDVFAYVVGSLIGKTKLYEKISPKKTWEGTLGGTVLSIFAAYLLSCIFLSLNLTNWLVIGLLISIFATLGDLTESMFKRQAGVKDSGNIMPGHGGVLDRFDGLLMAAPAIYVYLTI